MRPLGLVLAKNETVRTKVWAEGWKSCAPCGALTHYGEARSLRVLGFVHFHHILRNPLVFPFSFAVSCPPPLQILWLSLHPSISLSFICPYRWPVHRDKPQWRGELVTLDCVSTLEVEMRSPMGWPCAPAESCSRPGTSTGTPVFHPSPPASALLVQPPVSGRGGWHGSPVCSPPSCAWDAAGTKAWSVGNYCGEPLALAQMPIVTSLIGCCLLSWGSRHQLPQSPLAHALCSMT